MRLGPSPGPLRAQWVLWTGVALAVASASGVQLAPILDVTGEALALLGIVLWLSALSGLVVAYGAAGYIAMARRRR